MKFNKWTLGLAALAASAIIVSTGCKAHLENGGAYAPGITMATTNATGDVSTTFAPTQAPDIAFYYADAAYNTAYAIVDGALKWEEQNSAALWKLNPKIKRTLDSIRPKAWDIHVRWATARKEYLANPIPANLSIYQRIVSEIQTLTAAASAAEALSIAK